ncbi:MAG: nucleoside 2-deoxyribosyltransferase [bacterium]
MKIYFAGAIRGGRDDTDLYLQIIEHLKKYGEVLTEHIGDSNLNSLGENEKDEIIHNRDMKWLLSSDVVVAEITIPSLGVGYEIGRALENDKKILCLYKLQDGKRVSGMILGSGVDCKKYGDLEDAKQIMDNFFE